ncbi:MAG: ATPase domain-containing protein [Candidatus Jordarchaeaceae archaeon]
MNLVGSGMYDLDLLLGGGFIRDAPVLLLTETGTMGELLPLQIINNRIQDGDLGFIFDLDFPPVRIREWSKYFQWSLEGFESEGKLFIVDGFTNLYGSLPTEEKYVVENPRDIVYLDSYIYNMASLLQDSKNMCSGVLFLSNIFLAKGQQLDKIINLIYKTRITLSQYGLLIFAFNKRMMDEKTLSKLEHAFDYVIDLKVVEQNNIFQKYLRVAKSPLINYLNDVVPYEVAPSGINLRTEIMREFESVKQNLKMRQAGAVDLLGIQMTLIPSEAFELMSKILVGKKSYEEGSKLLHQLGRDLAYSISKNIQNKFKIVNLEEAILLNARIYTLMGLGELIIQDYNKEKGTILIRVNNSPICTPLKGAGKKMGALIEGAIEGVAEAYTLSNCKCEETKCIAQGDEYCEYLLNLKPKTNSQI